MTADGTASGGDAGSGGSNGDAADSTAQPGDTQPGTDTTTTIDSAVAETTAPTDTGPTDTGPTDTGPADTSPADTGPADIGPADTGPTDTGPLDSGNTAAGACVNPADTAIIAAKDVETIAKDCFIKNLSDPAKGKTCIVDQTGISDPCASCFQGVGACGASKCVLQCIADSGSKACNDCLNANCYPVFKTCSGLDPT